VVCRRARCGRSGARRLGSDRSGLIHLTECRMPGRPREACGSTADAGMRGRRCRHSRSETMPGWLRWRLAGDLRLLDPKQSPAGAGRGLLFAVPAGSGARRSGLPRPRGAPMVLGCFTTTNPVGCSGAIERLGRPRPHGIAHSLAAAGRPGTRPLRRVTRSFVHLARALMRLGQHRGGRFASRPPPWQRRRVSLVGRSGAWRSRLVIQHPRRT
jgi:hypothetical protein